MSNLLKFPVGFLWGSSTAAHQIEGGNYNNDWWLFEQKGGIIDGSSSKVACDNYHRYKQDSKLLKGLGQNSYRFSLEWSRVQPTEKEWNLREIEHYRCVLQDLKQQGLTTFVTLQHFTLPLWLSKIGGWENPKIVDYFRKYTEICAKNYSDLIDYWITINEPQVVVGSGYLQGNFPPEKQNPIAAIKAAKNIIFAHRAAYNQIHRTEKYSKVSFTSLNVDYCPNNKRATFDNLLVKFYRRLQNNYFIDETLGSLDYIGLDHYHHSKLKFNPLNPFTFFTSFISDTKERSDFGWDIYPKGILNVLRELKKYRLPIYICENGIADTEDTQRPRFIVDTLYFVWKAIQEGIDIRSYLHWSLMDNFEWQEGFSMHFGLCSTNYLTLKRLPRKSAYLYKQIIENNGLDKSLVKNILS